jgi:hypothetical protein
MMRALRRRSLWLDLLKSAYELPDVIADMNVEAVAAAKLAAETGPHRHHPSSEQLSSQTADRDAEFIARQDARLIVTVTRRLGDAGLLDALFAKVSSSPQDRLRTAILNLTGIPGEANRRWTAAGEMTTSLLVKLQAAGEAYAAGWHADLPLGRD